MKYQLVRQDRKTEKEYIIGKFNTQGDALWAATLFSSHKLIGSDYIHFVRKGKNIFYGCSSINTSSFHIF